MTKIFGILLVSFIFMITCSFQLPVECFEQSDCYKSVEEGPRLCKGFIRRWRWSVQDETCIETVYGGCHATRNNFQDYDTCMKIAQPVCSKLGDLGPVTFPN